MLTAAPASGVARAAARASRGGVCLVPDALASTPSAVAPGAAGIIGPMHLLIPFAAPLSDAGRQALGVLALPQLAAWLAGAAPADEDARDEADALSLSPPHERALARLVGLAGADGALPWAAWQAARDGVDAADHAWALLTPAHWHLGTDQLTMRDPLDLQLDEPGSRALLDAVRDLFETEGYAVAWGAPTRWYLAHGSLADLRSASPDRVIGRNVDPWLPPGPEARRLRRLQNEVQMRLHEHPLNAAREAQGLPAVNSVWISGCGAAQATRWPAGLVVDDRLRRPALAEDWDAWVAAWQALDADAVARLRGAGADATLTLCGERAALTLRGGGGTAWQRLRAHWRRADPRALLETL